MGPQGLSAFLAQSVNRMFGAHQLASPRTASHPLTFLVRSLTPRSQLLLIRHAVNPHGTVSTQFRQSKRPLLSFPCLVYNAFDFSRISSMELYILRHCWQAAASQCSMPTQMQDSRTRRTSLPCAFFLSVAALHPAPPGQSCLGSDQGQRAGTDGM